MRFTIPQHVLIKPLEQAAAAISNKPSLPILDGILFKVTKDQMTVVGGDGYTTIKANIAGDSYQADADWSFVLPHKKIVESVKRMEGDISFMASDKEIQIQSGRSKMVLTPIDAEEYPPHDNVKGQQIQMAGKQLKDLVAKTIFAVAEPKEQTTILTGLYFKFSGSHLQIIGCDRHRMAFLNEKIEGTADTEASLVVKREDVDKIVKLVGDKEKIEMTFGNSQIQVKTGEVTIVARLLEGAYPEVAKSIPVQHNTTLTVKTREFYKALEFASIIAREEKTRIVKMTVGNEIEFQASGSGGAANRFVEYDKIFGDGFKVAFNSEYVMDTIKAIDHEFTTIHFVENGNPIIFRGEDRQEETFLVLPYKIQG